MYFPLHHLNRACVCIQLAASMHVGAAAHRVSLLVCGISLQLQAVQRVWQDPSGTHHQRHTGCSGPTARSTHSLEGRLRHCHDSSSCVCWAQYNLQFLHFCDPFECDTDCHDLLNGACIMDYVQGISCMVHG